MVLYRLLVLWQRWWKWATPYLAPRAAVVVYNTSTFQISGACNLEKVFTRGSHTQRYRMGESHIGGSRVRQTARWGESKGYLPEAGANELIPVRRIARNLEPEKWAWTAMLEGDSQHGGKPGPTSATCTRTPGKAPVSLRTRVQQATVGVDVLEATSGRSCYPGTPLYRTTT